jgi:hypothetical protein
MGGAAVRGMLGTAGRLAGAVARGAPIIGGVLDAAITYYQTGDATKAGAVGVGAAVGAAFGLAMGGPIGMVIGGIMGHEAGTLVAGLLQGPGSGGGSGRGAGTTDMRVTQPRPNASIMRTVQALQGVISTGRAIPTTAVPAITATPSTTYVIATPGGGYTRVDSSGRPIPGGQTGFSTMTPTGVPTTSVGAVPMAPTGSVPMAVTGTGPTILPSGVPTATILPGGADRSMSGAVDVEPLGISGIDPSTIMGGGGRAMTTSQVDPMMVGSSVAGVGRTMSEADRASVSDAKEMYRGLMEEWYRTHPAPPFPSDAEIMSWSDEEYERQMDQRGISAWTRDRWNQMSSAASQVLGQHPDLRYGTSKIGDLGPGIEVGVGGEDFYPAWMMDGTPGGGKGGGHRGRFKAGEDTRAKLEARAARTAAEAGGKSVQVKSREFKVETDTFAVDARNFIIKAGTLGSGSAGVGGLGGGGGGGGGVGSMSGSGASIGSGKRADAVAMMNALVGDGWTPEQAAGFVGNAMQESGLDPTIRGDGGAARGLFQWHGDRWANYEAWLGGRDPDDPMNQTLFASYEARTTEAAAGRAIAGTSSVRDAALAVSSKFERPAAAYAANGARISYGEDAYRAWQESQATLAAGTPGSSGSALLSESTGYSLGAAPGGTTIVSAPTTVVQGAQGGVQADPMIDPHFVPSPYPTTFVDALAP